MKKHVFRVVLFVFVAVLSVLVVSAEDVAWGDCCDTLSWVVDDTGVLTISGDGEIYDWTSTEAPWISCGQTINTVIIEDGITKIGENSFSGLTSLEKITISDGVSNVSVNAFSETGYYNNLTNWESGVLYIGKHLIAASDALPDYYEVKSGTTCIADNAFENRENLKSIVIPAGVVRIGKYAFYDCTALSTISLPDNAMSIGEKCFNGTAYFENDSNWVDTQLYIGKHFIRARDEQVYMASFTCYGFVKDGTLSIADEAFCGCIYLKVVSIPKSVRIIGDRMLSETTYKSFYFRGKEAEWNEIAIGEDNYDLFVTPKVFTEDIEVPDYEINSITLKDTSYSEISSIPETAFFAVAEITNNSFSEDALFMMCAYDEAGTLICMDLMYANPPVESTFSYGVQISNSDGRVAKLKAFVFKAEDALTPLAEAVEFTQEA